MTTVFANSHNRCSWCGQRGFSDAELIPGWYISGVFTPMAGGIFTHCVDCFAAPIQWAMPVVDRALAAIELGRQRRRREVRDEQ